MPELKAVFFDAGDTLMRVFPFNGRMVDWPEVAAVDGAAEALMQLRRRYRLAVLTNAQDSSAGDVAAAMRRVGLDVYIATYITSRNIGVLKPDPAFFHAGLQALDVDANQAVMVGDSYDADVLGARRAGLHAVWYNPRRAPCPSAHPAYDAAVSDLRDLPAVLAAPFLPDVPTCLAWLAEQNVTGDLLPHVRLVAAVAFRLAERLAAAGEDVNPLLAHRGGLLHDLAKASAKERGVSHEREAGRLLRERGLPALARIAERHPVWAPLNPTRNLKRGKKSWSTTPTGSLNRRASSLSMNVWPPCWRSAGNRPQPWLRPPPQTRPHPQMRQPTRPLHVRWSRKSPAVGMTSGDISGLAEKC